LQKGKPNRKQTQKRKDKLETKENFQHIIKQTILNRFQTGKTIGTQNM